jgi:hypothetical protein
MQLYNETFYEKVKYNLSTKAGNASTNFQDYPTDMNRISF